MPRKPHGGYLSEMPPPQRRHFPKSYELLQQGDQLSHLSGIYKQKMSIIRVVGSQPKTNERRQKTYKAKEKILLNIFVFYF